MDENIKLQDYLEKYLVFEVDFLTDDVKNKVDVDLEDCYMLCYSFCDAHGRIEFMVLSIGDSVDNCVKGLSLPGPLKSYSYDEIMRFPFEEIAPTCEMVEKCEKLLNLKDPLMASDKLRKIRSIDVLDEFRDVNYPDIVKANVLVEDRMLEARVRLKTIDKYGMLVGRVIESKGDLEKHLRVNVVVAGFADEKVVLAIPSEQLDMFREKVHEHLSDEEDVMEELEEILDEISSEINGEMKYRS